MNSYMIIVNKVNDFDCCY